MFDLRSLFWGFGESCTIVQGINSESENVLSTFSSISNCFGSIWKGDFSTPQFRDFHSLAPKMVLRWPPITQMGDLDFLENHSRGANPQFFAHS